MEDSEGVLSFDFEGGLDAAPPAAATASAPSAGPLSNQNDSTAAAAAAAVPNGAAAPAPTSGDPGAAGNVPGRRSFRQTVCRHWLRSLCMKGDACGFLHQYDKARMPVCRFFRLYGECREQDCVYKHTNEDIKECNMYKLGFCPNGPDCRYRHAKSAGPPPPVDEVLQKIQHLYSYNYNASNKFFQQRGSNYNQQAEKSQFPQGNNPTNQAVAGKPVPAESGNVQQQQVQQAQQPVNQSQVQSVANGQPNQANKTATPLPQGISRYFIVKSCNRENLELSVQQGVWATQRSNESKLNEAFDSVENVILIFSVNRTRHFQGCAKMTSRIGGSVAGGNWKYAHGTAHYGRNFSVKWLKLCELSFHKTRHLRNPYNENLPVKISRDCQELEPSIGEQLASLLYLEPDSELMAISIAAESKREEEKAKGVNPDNGGENPDIVPFEDNEEEEEEESDEEEESIGHVVGPAVQGRGRGRGMMWPPHMPLARGARPMPGIPGFNPVMMGDGLSYGPVGPDGFGMPDLFGVGPRGFPPYGPRFSGDFAGPPAAMMFRGRPSQPGMFPGGGFGMMMNPARPHFMGGMGANPPRAGRPVNMPPMFPPPPPPPQNNNRLVKRDQRINDRNDKFGPGLEQGKNQDMMSQSGGPDDDMQGYKAQQDDQYAVNNLRNDDSESEDEAPRRSRHGEGKKRRRSLEDANASSNH
ncbi:30-kDa cleavage and polyadenylation specificity factor 30 [Stylosanthes scabra]|uniref:30-kDa cleavage and polyadenylation specificity factor 30 n=1 Tax=Stylosanthes scabra TaxID=79078 RepID=A0ABU6YMY0_9FABA|nr:30-kDa cleavage and polyadenylation specificity factor 30 [Stylosanthes scabra]